MFRLTPSVRAILSSLVVVPSLSVFTRMALLSPGLSCLPFFKPPYNQQVSLESSQAIIFELELQLLLPGRAFLTISLRLWGVGLAKLTCYMCVLRGNHPLCRRTTCLAGMNSSTLHLGRFSGRCQIWAFFFQALTSPAKSPPFLRAMPSLLGGPLAWHGGSWLGCLTSTAIKLNTTEHFH